MGPDGPRGPGACWYHAGLMSSPFTPKTLAFLRALKRNNDREWFREHKD